MSATLSTPKTTSGGEIITHLINSTDGAGLHFDGTSGNVEIAKAPSDPPDLGTKFSFEFVVQADAWVTSTSIHLVDFGSSGRFIFGGSSANSGNLSVYSGGWDSFDVNPLSDLKVHHIVVTISDTAAILYDNGNEIATATLPSSPTIDLAGDARIGADNGGGYYFFNGTIYRARLWNKTLSQTDVTSVYESASLDFADQWGSQTDVASLLNSSFASWTADDPDSWTVFGESGGTDPEISEVGSGESHGGTGTGSVNIYSTSTYAGIKQVQTLVIGKKYRITVVISAIAGGLRVFDNSGVVDWDETYTTTGTKIIEFTATATAPPFELSRQSGGATDNVTIDSVSFVEIGCVSDFDFSYANPSQSDIVRNRNDTVTADGTAAGGVVQITAIDQLNSRSARIGTSAATPADGDLLVSGNVGVGTSSPAASLEIRKQFTDTTAVERVLILDSHDDSAVLPLDAGDGVGILFKIPEATGSAIGASIDAERTSGADGDTSTQLVFRTSQNDETLDTALTIDSTGNVNVGSKISLNADGAINWGNADDAGRLTWDTNDALVRGQSGKNLQLGANNSTHLTIDTTGLATFSSPTTATITRVIKVGSGSGTDGNGNYIEFPSSTTDNLGSRITGTRVGAGADSDLIFSTYAPGVGALQRARISSTGLAVTGAVTATTLSTFSAGIAFSGQTNTAATGAAMVATTLDHYEEGTWTPTVSFAGVATGITYNTDSTDAIYTRVGNYVFCDFVIQLTSKGSSTGVLQISGFPFPSSDYASGTALDFIGGNLMIGAGSVIDNGAFCTVIGAQAYGYCYDSSMGAQIVDTNLTDTTMIRGNVKYRI